MGNCCYLLIVNIHTHDMLVSEEKIYITPHDLHNSPSQVAWGDTNISQKCRQSMVHRWHAGKLQIHFTFHHRLRVYDAFKVLRLQGNSRCAKVAFRAVNRTVVFPVTETIPTVAAWGPSASASQQLHHWHVAELAVTKLLQFWCPLLVEHPFFLFLEYVRVWLWHQESRTLANSSPFQLIL